MPDLRTTCYYAMYVIGEVESGWNWSSVNYNDPITIGMMQWFGTRAAGLLNRLRNEVPESYSVVAQSLRTDVEGIDQGSAYWNTRYLTNAEGESVAIAFQQVKSHIVQENQAIEDFVGYVPTLESWGASQSSPQALVFCMSMYHQSPAQCRTVMLSTNPQNLDAVHDACLADSIFGNYTRRYNTVYARLKGWDGVSEPPDFGQTGNAGSDSPNLTSYRWIEQHGDLMIAKGYSKPLVLYHSGGIWVNGKWHLMQSGSNLYLNGKQFVKTNADVWVGKYEIEPDIPPAGQNPNAKTLEWARQYLGQWEYIFGGGRPDPVADGGTDCSGFVIAAYLQTRGIVLGSYTGNIWTTTYGAQIWYGRTSNWDDVPWDKLQEGDVMLMSSNTYDFTSGDGSHTGLYTGVPYYFIDCGSTPCPTERMMTWYPAIAIGVMRPNY